MIQPGHPLADISVNAENATGNAVGTATDASGKYTIKGLPLGKYTISSPSSARWAINDGDYIRQTQDVTISAASPDASGIDFALVKGGSISGTVNDTAGHPLADISVNAENDTGDAAGTATDASGKIRLKAYPSGSTPSVRPVVPDGRLMTVTISWANAGCNLSASFTRRQRYRLCSDKGWLDIRDGK